MENIQELTERYIAAFPSEKMRLNQFVDFLTGTKFNQLFDRKNFIGHITASSLIVDSSRSKVLLIKHKAIDRWLQPGGHVDPSDDTLVNAAIREAKEETGIDDTNLTLISRHLRDGVPIDIDTHYIEKNTYQSEDEHYHHDFRYLFLYTGAIQLAQNSGEKSEYKWVNFSELARDTTFALLVEKIRHALSFEFRTKQFYDAIIKHKDREYPSAQSIVVSHIIPDCVYFLRAVNELFPIISIVPKPNSIDPPTYDLVKQDFDVTHISRTTINDAQNELLAKIQSASNKVILFDIGGYFSQIHEKWPSEVIAKILMIIEDTENGHQKYEQAQGSLIRVISAARSPLKDNEDFLVGQSVLFSADSLMRTGGTLIQYMKCGVFGYGKIGKSIAFHLLQHGIKPSVYDQNPIRRVEAHNRLCSIPTPDEIIEKSDVIFSATGNQCLKIGDFRRLKNGCFVFSVTSSEDEMDLRFLEAEYACTQIKPALFKYSNDHNFFFLVSKGNAVNFLHNAIMGNFIHLVRSEMILSTSEPENELVSKEGIYEISLETRSMIAQIWLNVFDPEHREISSIEYIL